MPKSPYKYRLVKLYQAWIYDEGGMLVEVVDLTERTAKAANREARRVTEEYTEQQRLAEDERRKRAPVLGVGHNVATYPPPVLMLPDE